MRPLIRSVRCAHCAVRPPPFPSRMSYVASPDMAGDTSELSETVAWLGRPHRTFALEVS
jgi:hypothetical protein